MVSHFDPVSVGDDIPDCPIVGRGMELGTEKVTEEMRHFSMRIAMDDYAAYSVTD